MSTSSSTRSVSPPRIGELAPNLARACGAEPHRGGDRTPVVIAFHEPCWDRARVAEIEAYRRLVNATGEAALQPTLIRNDAPSAELCGVAGNSAVFVIDPDGRVARRYVRGVDCLASPSESSQREQSTTISDDNRGGCSRRHFVATSLAAAVAIALEPLMHRTDTTAFAQPIPAPSHDAIAATVGAPVPVRLAVKARRRAATMASAARAPCMSTAAAHCRA